MEASNLKERFLGVGRFLGVLFGVPLTMGVSFILFLGIGTIINRWVSLSQYDYFYLIAAVIFCIGFGVAFLVYVRVKIKKIYVTVAGISGLLIGLMLIIVSFADYNPAQRPNSLNARKLGDLQGLRVVLELYFDENNSYPEALSQLSPKFITKVPTDPITQKSYFYATNSINGKITSWHLGANLEIKNEIIFNNDQDCNSITGQNCPQNLKFNSNPFDGSDNKGCGGEENKFCYDIVP